MCHIFSEMKSFLLLIEESSYKHTHTSAEFELIGIQNEIHRDNNQINKYFTCRDFVQFVASIEYIRLQKKSMKSLRAMERFSYIIKVFTKLRGWTIEGELNFNRH